MSGIDSDLIRGHIDTIILKVLSDGDKYGIEICKEVEEKSNGTYELKQPTLYSCLKRLEGQGLISSYWEDSDIGGKRHYYKLTDAGKESYVKNQEEWMRSRQIIDNLISNNYEEATSYTLMKKEDIETLERKAEIVKEDETPSIDEQTSSPTFNQVEDEDIIPWATTNELNVLPEEKSVNETYMLEEESKSVLVDVAPNGEITAASVSENEEDFEWKTEDPQEEIVGQSSLFENGEETIFEELEEQESGEEKDSEVDIMQLLGHSVAEPISYEKKEEIEYSEKPQIETVEEPLLTAPEEKEDNEVSPFNFRMEDFVIKSRNSYFESEESASPTPDYIAPEMKIDGLKEDVKAEETVEEEQENSEFESSETPVYHNFGADSFIQNFNHKIEEDDDKIVLDESNYDPESLYLNPEAENQNNEINIFDEDDDKLKLFSEDIFEDNEYSKNEEKEETNPIFSEPVSQGEVLDMFKASENYQTIEPKYTEDEYKKKLSSLMAYTSSPRERNDSVKNESVSKATSGLDSDNYSDLKEDFEKEGLTVRVHYKMVKESKATRSYVESNKLNVVNAWTSFSIVGFITLLTYLIMENNNTSCFGFSYKYFLIGLSVLAVIPVIYTLIYFINPFKKKQARYASRMYILFSILLTLQFLLIIYCVNLQLGFYSFTQENYNHLYWIVPCILSLYPLADSILHTVYFNSKNFHV